MQLGLQQQQSCSLSTDTPVAAHQSRAAEHRQGTQDVLTKARLWLVFGPGATLSCSLGHPVHSTAIGKLDGSSKGELGLAAGLLEPP